MRYDKLEGVILCYHFSMAGKPHIHPLIGMAGVFGLTDGQHSVGPSIV